MKKRDASAASVVGLLSAISEGEITPAPEAFFAKHVTVHTAGCAHKVQPTGAASTQMPGFRLMRTGAHALPGVDGVLLHECVIKRSKELGASACAPACGSGAARQGREARGRAA